MMKSMGMKQSKYTCRAWTIFQLSLYILISSYVYNINQLMRPYIKTLSEYE